LQNASVDQAQAIGDLAIHPVDDSIHVGMSSVQRHIVFDGFDQTGFYPTLAYHLF
jgi:hypothetical protein